MVLTYLMNVGVLGVFAVYYRYCYFIGLVCCTAYKECDRFESCSFSSHFVFKYKVDLYNAPTCARRWHQILNHCEEKHFRECAYIMGYLIVNCGVCIIIIVVCF